MSRLKSIGNPLVWIVFLGLGTKAKAKSYVRNAANCMPYEAFLKEASKTKIR